MTYSRTILAIWLGAAVLASDSNQAAQQKPAEPNTTAKPAEPNIAIKPLIPQITTPPKLTLNEIIRRASTWDTAYTRWYGKESPDFTVIDLNGKTHTLSQYRGKNVMLIFWATWCPPCLAEIPHLIKLRKEIGEDKLVILGISYVDQRNPAEAIKRLVQKNPSINYPITPTNPAMMPKPYILINVLPTSFFIDPQGKIKLAAEGMVPLPQIKAIIEADSTPSTSSGQVNSPQAEQ
jgi:thiol-disulfide isomerase/thioredoxin